MALLSFTSVAVLTFYFTRGILNSEIDDKIKNRIDGIKQGIEIKAAEQKSEIEEIVKSMSSISETTQENAEGATRMAKNSDLIFEMSQKMKNEIDYFKIDK
jgi:methyl-accepting chemotaxis protein